MNRYLKRFGGFAVLVVLAVFFDQWTKSLAFGRLRGNGPYVIINGVFELLYSENRGAAFGILQGKHGFFFLVAAAVLIVVLLLLAKLPEGKKYVPLYVCMVLLASGAIGNLIDRVSRGFVVDFFYFSLIDFPIFNVADCYVVLATVFLILLTGFFYRDEDLQFLSGKHDRREGENG